MSVNTFKSLFYKHKEPQLNHRYITHNHIVPLLDNFNKSIPVETIGHSVLNIPIHGLKIGSGEKRILMWSQMHGNETTTTKALFDLLNTLIDKDSKLDYILHACTLYIIPMLNPDGAKAYTRVNANSVDLNRDAQNLTQPESKVLRQVFEAFKPHFCYNLHGQRTIFSAGKANNVATVSFLTPAQDPTCTVTPSRKISMEIIAQMNAALQSIIPNQVGVYDDAFNLNCVGDTFQSENVPTILFEAGHFKDDYGREYTRELIYISYLVSLDYISKNNITGANYKPYFDIPENEKCFFDIIIRNASLGDSNNLKDVKDIGILYQEQLVDGKIFFSPKVVEISKLEGFYGHREFDAHYNKVFNTIGKHPQIEEEMDCFLIDNKKTSLILV